MKLYWDKREIDEEKLKAETVKKIRLLVSAYEQEMLNQSAISDEEKIPSGIDGFGNLCVEKKESGNFQYAPND